MQHRYLPVVQPGPKPVERADASRNRARILAAAEGLFARESVMDVTMEDIAAAAGVGRATLYRRFPDRAAVAAALLDVPERALQRELLAGAPPLGPGATPAARLAAFSRAMVELLDRYGHLALVVEVGGARLEAGAYGFWRAHVSALIHEAGRDPSGALVETLLAPLAPEVVRFQRQRLDLSTTAIADPLVEIAYAILGDPVPEP